MKKIFYFIASAVVALGATACQNDINDTVTPDQQGESVSISVTIADQTRVSLGDFEEGKGYKLSFEEGDQLCVSNAWGGTGTEADYWFTYTKTEGDTYVFTCTADGVGALLGTEQNVFYFGGAPAGNGSVCNTAKEDISGVGMNGETSAFGTEPIVLNVLPVLKYSSEYPVTFTASKGTFSSEAGRWATSYTATKTGSDIYIPMYSSGTYTLTASIMGQEVKSKEITFEKNKIYNLGTIEAPEIEKDEANITIDGVFTDWDDVTINMAVLPADATSNVAMKTFKAYADATNLYFYAEVAPAEVMHMGLLLDLDNNGSTGDSYWVFGSGIGAEVWVENWCIFNGGEAIPFYWGNYNVYDSGWVVGSATFDACAPVEIGGGLAAIELSMPRSLVEEKITTPYIGIGAYTLTSWGASGVLPSTGIPMVIPVE